MALLDDSTANLHDLENEEEEALTAAEVLAKLEEAWLNEKFAPELLPNKSEIVDCILELLQQMQENIDNARQKKGSEFKVGIHRMEIDRIRYVLSSYLRLRLQKIEKYTTHLLETDRLTKTPCMTPEEFTFAKEYQASIESHFNTLALQHMPVNQRALDPKQTVVRPGVSSYVFMRVRHDISGVPVDDDTADGTGEVIDLVAGDQHIVRYQPIASLVNSAQVVLL